MTHHHNSLVESGVSFLYKVAKFLGVAERETFYHYPSICDSFNIVFVTNCLKIVGIKESYSHHIIGVGLYFGVSMGIVSHNAVVCRAINKRIR
jgi:hypothetical protein